MLRLKPISTYTLGNTMPSVCRQLFCRFGVKQGSVTVVLFVCFSSLLVDSISLAFHILTDGVELLMHIATVAVVQIAGRCYDIDRTDLSSLDCRNRIFTKHLEQNVTDNDGETGY